MQEMPAGILRASDRGAMADRKCFFFFSPIPSDNHNRWLYISIPQSTTVTEHPVAPENPA